MIKSCRKIVLHKLFEPLSFGLIILTVCLYVTSTELKSPYYADIFRMFDYVIGVIFVIEYIIRICAAKNIRKSIFSSMMIIDFIVIISIFYPVSYNLTVLRLLKIFRFLHLKKYQMAITIMGKVWKSQKEELALTVVFFLVTISILATVGYFFEGQYQETFSSIPKCLYWVMITATSVGYGDVVPITVGGKCIAVLTSTMGLLTYGMITAIFASGFTQEMKNIKF